MRILIVDDTTFMRTTIKRILSEDPNQEHELYEAENGLEAVNKYKILSPELVIMDISMPVMDGIQAVKEIKAFDPHADVIICSLQGQKNNVMEAIKSGARSFIVKPVKAEKLFAEIAKIPKRTKVLPKLEPEVIEASFNETDSFHRSEDYLKGVEAGYLEAKMEIATNMIRMGLDMEVIMTCVEITDETYRAYKEEYNL